MGYGFTCDDCGTEHPNDLPAFVGEVREQWFKTTDLGGIVADMGYSPGETLTLCGDCTLDTLDS